MKNENEKKRNIRAFIVRRVPDSIFLRVKYRKMTGKRLDLRNPKTFNEKLQWLKLHNRKPIYTTMVDKYAVKEYVAALIGEEYIIPTLGVWSHYDEIDFASLPNQFVLKCTHDCESVKIIRDKNSINHEDMRLFFEQKLTVNYYYTVREWPYKKVKPRIIAEEYLADLATQQIIDYKFFCMNGKPAFLYVSVGLDDHSTAKISFYSLGGRELPFKRNDYAPFHNAKMPASYELMKEIAGKLAADISAPFVRVDLYEVNHQVLFSEITFFPCGGFIPFEPEEWDRKLGDLIKLPKKKLIGEKNENRAIKNIQSQCDITGI